jgi:hypothetical protein
LWQLSKLFLKPQVCTSKLHIELHLVIYNRHAFFISEDFLFLCGFCLMVVLFAFPSLSTKLYSGIRRQNSLNTSNIYTSNYLLLWNPQWLPGGRGRQLTGGSTIQLWKSLHCADHHYTSTATRSHHTSSTWWDNLKSFTKFSSYWSLFSSTISNVISLYLVLVQYVASNSSSKNRSMNQMYLSANLDYSFWRTVL